MIRFGNPRDEVIEAIKEMWFVAHHEHILKVLYEPSTFTSGAFVMIEAPSGKYQKTFPEGAMIKDVIDWITSRDPKIAV